MIRKHYRIIYTIIHVFVDHNIIFSLYLFHGIGCFARSHRFRYLVQLLCKLLPVLCHLNGGDRSSQDPHVVLPQSATLLQLHTAVEGSLTAKREEDTVRALALYHLNVSARIV